MSHITEQQLAEFAATTLDASDRLVGLAQAVLIDDPGLSPEIKSIVQSLMDSLAMVARMNAKSTAHALWLSDLNTEMVDKLNALIEKHMP